MVFPPPPIQYALLESIGAASLLFVLLKIIKTLKIKDKSEYVPRFLTSTLGRSTLLGIFYLTATWLLTSFYIFLFGAGCYIFSFPIFCHTCVYFEIFLWTMGFVGCFYASISIIKLLIIGDFRTTFGVD
jgi:hypothetical protein